MQVLERELRLQARPLLLRHPTRVLISASCGGGICDADAGSCSESQVILHWLANNYRAVAALGYYQTGLD